jgi:hypothetical protein
MNTGKHEWNSIFMLHHIVCKILIQSRSCDSHDHQVVIKADEIILEQNLSWSSCFSSHSFVFCSGELRHGGITITSGVQELNKTYSRRYNHYMYSSENVTSQSHKTDSWQSGMKIQCLNPLPEQRKRLQCLFFFLVERSLRKLWRRQQGIRETKTNMRLERRNRRTGT